MGSTVPPSNRFFSFIFENEVQICYGDGYLHLCARIKQRIPWKGKKPCRQTVTVKSFVPNIKVKKSLQTHQNFVVECSLPLAWNRVVVAMWNSCRSVTSLSFLLRVLVQLVKQEILVLVGSLQFFPFTDCIKLVSNDRIGMGV